MFNDQINYKQGHSRAASNRRNMNKTVTNWTGMNKRAEKFTTENRKKYVEDFIELVEASEIVGDHGVNIPGQVMFRRLMKSPEDLPKGISTLENSDEDD